MPDKEHNVSRRQIITTGLGAASAMLLASGCRSTRPVAQPMLTTEPEPLDIGPDADIRCGIIGVGGRGTGVLRAIHNAPHVRVTAICDIDKGHLDRAAGIVADDKPQLFTRYQKMLEFEPLDAVFVATPCYLHAEMVIAVHKSGRHCYAEKPMAINVADLDAMVRVVNASRRVYQVGTQLPYASPWHGAIQAIRDREVGEPVLIRAHRHNAGDLPHDIPWFFKRKLSGDTILEQAVHEFDIFNAIMDGIPERAAGFGGQAVRFEPPGRDIMDHYDVAFHYGKNKEVGYSHSWISAPGVPCDGRQEIVYCTEGVVDVEGGMVYPRKGKPRKVNAEPKGDSTQLAVNHFFECVRKGKQPITDAIRGRNGALVALLGLMAIDTGRVVTMNEVIEKQYSA